jgi:hypothetical protein
LYIYIYIYAYIYICVWLPRFSLYFFLWSSGILQESYFETEHFCA